MKIKTIISSLYMQLFLVYNLENYYRIIIDLIIIENYYITEKHHSPKAFIKDPCAVGLVLAILLLIKVNTELVLWAFISFHLYECEHTEEHMSTLQVLPVLN